jgi:hypothetical protein
MFVWVNILPQLRSHYPLFFSKHVTIGKNVERKMFFRRTAALVLIILVFAGCNLTTAPPTPTLAPTQPPTFAPLASAAPTGELPPANPDCPLTPAGWVAYTVEAGDSLSLLAEQTGTTVDELVTANCLDNPDQIYVDFVIFLPQAPVISP